MALLGVEEQRPMGKLALGLTTQARLLYRDSSEHRAGGSAPPVAPISPPGSPGATLPKAPQCHSLRSYPPLCPSR